MRRKEKLLLSFLLVGLLGGLVGRRRRAALRRPAAHDPSGEWQEGRPRLRRPDLGDGPTSLARFSGGEQRTYSFAVTMPDHGDPGARLAGDNSLQDSATSVDFVWSASSLRSPGGRRCRYGILGTSGADVIAAGKHGRRILGRGGDDRIHGGGARDCIYGGRGDHQPRGGGADLLRGGYGDDVLRGGPGDDRIRGRQGDDLVVGGPGRERLRGTAGDDVIDSADGGPDRVRCSVGNDTAIADPADRLSGCERVVFR